MNQYWHIINKLHGLFRFPYFLPNFLFMFQDFPLHLVVISSEAPCYDTDSDFPCL